MSVTSSGVREHNRAIVEQYMACRGTARLRRHELFAEHGEGGLWTSDTGNPVVTRGREQLGEHAKWSLKCFPDWRWINVRIFTTDDPNFIWVECDGEGAIRFEGYAEGHYHNHFMHSFEFDNGLIVRQREFMNPVQQYRALGIPVPEIRRVGMPT